MQQLIPFALPLEKRDAFAFSQQPIPISEIAKRINDLTADENMEKLSYRAIRDWLTELGMLGEVLDSNGKTVKRPTPRGKEIGIAIILKRDNSEVRARSKKLGLAE